MKSVIRRYVFETNSSSVHTITICSEDKFNDWVEGKLLYSRWQESFIEPGEMSEETARDYGYQTYEEFLDTEDLDTFVQHYVTESGDKIVAFGVYGYNG